MKRIIPVVLVVISFPFFLPAQKPADSSSVRRDSVVIIVPIPAIGSVDPFGTPTDVITSRDITYTEYRSLYDIMSHRPGHFVRDLASPGQRNQWSVNGIDDRQIAVLVDGIPYNDPFTGTYNLWDIPVDAVERIEMVTGPMSMFYDGLSDGGTMNIVTKNFNNNRARTQLRYSQGISGYTHTDASFAQNILSGVNLSLGLAHYGFGSNKEFQNYRARFLNSNDDAWHFRSKLRYTPSSWINFSLSYTYDRRWTGLFGGVDYRNTVSLFEGLRATVRSEEAYEKTFNSHTHAMTAISPFSDSSLHAVISFYSFDRLREYRDEENRAVFTNGIITRRDFRSSITGTKLQLAVRQPLVVMLGYADLRRWNGKDRITIGGKAEIFPRSAFRVTPFVSLLDANGEFFAHGGAEGSLRFAESLTIFGGTAVNLLADRSTFAAASVTTPFVPYHSSPMGIRSTIQIGMEYRWEKYLAFRIAAQRREHDLPLINDTVATVQSTAIPSDHAINAVQASLHSAVGEFHLEMNAQLAKRTPYVRNGITLTLYPEATGSASLYFQGTLAGGSLDLRTGFRGNFRSAQTGMTPYDEYSVWLPSSEVTYGPGGTIDFFAVGKIGDAYVHVIWENVTGNQYFLAPFYPMYDGNVRFGLSWEFID